MLMQRITKQAARYTSRGGVEHCSLCRHFVRARGGSCKRVEGAISPAGWCRLFSRELAASVLSPHASVGGGGPSLGIDFMTPGSLDPRITFTRASTATYFNAAGLMQAAATNAPRWDYDPTTLQLRGLLVEEQRTNISTDFTGYTDNAATRTFNAGIAPDGTNTAVRLAETSAANIHFTQRISTTTTNVMYIFSVYAKAAEVRYLQLFSDNGTNDGAFVTFDLQTGTISQAAQVRGVGVLGGVAIQPCSGGVFRVSLGVQVAGTVYRSGILLSQTAAPGFAPSYPGNPANGVLIWGVQLEAGAFQTSYIPTTSAAVTRAADNCSMPVGAWYDATKGSLFGEYIYEGVPSANPYGSPLALVGANVDADWIRPNGTHPGPKVVFANVQVAGVGVSGAEWSPHIDTPIGVMQRTAMSWAQNVRMYAAHNSIAATVNVTGTNTTLPVITNLMVGGRVGYQDPQCLWARNVRYWNRQLSQAEMQQVTTL